MALEDREGLLVEFGGALVDRRVRAGLEHNKFTPLIPFVNVSAKRGPHTWSWRPRVICVGALIRASWARASWAITAFNSRIKASSGCVGRLRTKATTLAMNSGLPESKLRREAPGQDALDDHFRDAVQALGGALPALNHGFEEGVALGPATVQRQRFDAFRIFAAKP